KDLSRLSDPMAKLMMALRPLYTELENTRDRQGGALNLYYGLYAEAKQAFQQADFIPDANRTLRLTYGRIRGYSPSDATTCTPITTATGILQKTTYEEPYDTPKPLIDLIRKGDFGIFKHKRLNNLPVGILYNTDTTGGNSGSPVLNAKGELIGLNFDRTYEATVNDYAWTETYSRSIGVDIRYVLWVTQKYAGASQLLKEMNVPVD
ncbi:MAG: S46 family peptidase, partial [Bacteroidetes bacterium]|nr:S46 family peptidase [Bacteroidota bacterium]